MEDDYWEEIWRCRKHPSPPRSGVCPACLRDRLLLICADCANIRPCACSASTSSSSSDDYVGGDADGVGAVGRVANLIESEPAFRRSRSVTFQFLIPRLEAAAPRPRGRLSIWPFYRAAAPGEVGVKLSKSRSVGVSCPDHRRSGGGDGGGEVRGKGWKWHFPSPMKAFRQRKAANVVQVRSPLCRG